jgi:hypothetical protein
MRALSGLIILILYYCNVSWASFMPINSNASFDNTMQQYNVSRVLGDDNTVDIDAYLEYGPPYYAIANLYVVSHMNLIFMGHLADLRLEPISSTTPFRYSTYSSSSGDHLRRRSGA